MPDPLPLVRLGDSDAVDSRDAQFDLLLDKGRYERTMIFGGTEAPNRQEPPVARTRIQITFRSENHLREAARLLRWSGRQLERHPARQEKWDWMPAYRTSMTIEFGVNWHDTEFFEQQKEALQLETFTHYQTLYGTDPDDFQVVHELRL